jgi:hypothetical protein
MKYILGVLGSKIYDIDKKTEDYGLKLEVTEDVYNWLDNHDTEYTEERERVFIVNNLRYVDLGPKLPIGVPMGAVVGEA